MMRLHSPKFNIAPETCCLEEYFPFGDIFEGANFFVKLQGCFMDPDSFVSTLWSSNSLEVSFPDPLENHLLQEPTRCRIFQDLIDLTCLDLHVDMYQIYLSS